MTDRGPSFLTREWASGLALKKTYSPISRIVDSMHYHAGMPVRNGGPYEGLSALRPKANHRHITAYDDSSAKPTASVVKMPTPPSKEKERRKLEHRFSRQVVGSYGFTQLPNLLLYAQARLKITPTQFNVLLISRPTLVVQNKAPHPKIETIARRMAGKSERMVLRYLGGLEKAGLMTPRAPLSREAKANFQRLPARRPAGAPDRTRTRIPKAGQRVSRRATKTAETAA